MYEAGQLLRIKLHVSHPRVDVWPFPAGKYDLSYPLCNIDDTQLCLVLDCEGTSVKVVTECGVVGWIETWDLDVP